MIRSVGVGVRRSVGGRISEAPQVMYVTAESELSRAIQLPVPVSRAAGSHRHTRGLTRHATHSRASSRATGAYLVLVELYRNSRATFETALCV